VERSLHLTRPHRWICEPGSTIATTCRKKRRLLPTPFSLRPVVKPVSESNYEEEVLLLTGRCDVSLKNEDTSKRGCPDGFGVFYPA